MERTYEGILENDRIRWTGEAPPGEGPRPVRVTVQEPEEEASDREARVAEALARLAAVNPFREVEDPVAWQSATRRDRPLPGRKE